MKRLLLLITLTLASFSLMVANAEAKRLGGGSSIGKQRTMSPQQTQQSTAATPAPAAAGAAAPAAQGNKWLGPLAGLAIGAGLGALFMGGGMGGAFGSILMMVAVAALVMFLIAKFRKPQQPAMQYAGQGAPYQHVEPQQYAGGASAVAPAAARNIPADFPQEAFLRSAKTSFIRLQAANDRKDLNDVREYTTPEMYAEISMQFSERGSAAQTTEVVSVNAELLEVANEHELAIASVRMSGQLRENNGAPEAFDEIWHVQKDLQDSKSVWLLAGIQQIQ
jgi:predicted lipid-binding transport protein (Tim44 family)